MNPEVYISKEDKEELIIHIKAIKEIADKYPYSNNHSSDTETSMSRIKSWIFNLYKWIWYLEVQ